MRAFGLTGGIACGKSTVAAFLKKLGAYVIDADQAGHELLLPESPLYLEILRRFGSGIVDPSGYIDRRRLGKIVFSAPEKLSELNALLHPLIMSRIEAEANERLQKDSGAVIVAEAALIYEAKLAGRFWKVIVAWCRPEQQVERLLAKTALSRIQAQSRIATQMPIGEKKKLADYLVDCSGSVEETRAEVRTLFGKLQRLVLAG